MYYRKKKKKNTFEHIRAAAAAACWCAALKKQSKIVRNQAAAWCTETDGQTVRSFFLRDNHHLLLAQLVSAGTRVIASRYQPSTGPSQSASDAHTNMTIFRRPASSTNPRRSWGYRSRFLPRVSPRALTLNKLDTLALGVLGEVSGLRTLHWSQSYLKKNVLEKIVLVRVSSNKLEQDKIIAGADISTHATDDAVCFRVHAAY